LLTAKILGTNQVTLRGLVVAVATKASLSHIGIEGINTDEAPTEDTKSKPTKPSLPPEAQIVEIPFTDIEVPMPTTTIMTTAATTAFISVAATLTATSLFKYIVMVLKPVFKQTWSKLTKKKNPS
jgi:hypothetical protein